MKNIIYILICFTLLSSCNVIASEQEYKKVSMPLNEVISGGVTIDDSKNDRTDYTFIDSNSNLWLSSSNKYNNYEPIKIMDNVISVKSNFLYGSNIIVLKKDKSVWYGNINSELEKIMDNVIIINSGPTCETIYAIKEDGSLWFYNTYGVYSNININGIYYKNKEPIKIMDDVLYVKASIHKFHDDWQHYFIILKKDGSLWQSDVNCIDYPKKVMDNIIAFDVDSSYATAVAEDGNLYFWECDKLQNKDDIINLTDGVKYAKFSDLPYISVLKEDNSLWIYGLFNSDLKKFNFIEKIYDNIYAILGNNDLFYMDYNKNIISDSVPKSISDENNNVNWDIKPPNYSIKNEIKLNKEEFENYLSITQKCIQMKNNLIKQLNEYSSKIINNTISNKNEIEIINQKIVEYENYLKENKDFIIINASDAGSKGIKIYTYNDESNIFYSNKDKLSKIKENSYSIKDTEYSVARRKYVTNMICFSNNWIDLTSYIKTFFKDNTCIEINDMKITKKNNIYNIDLKSVKSYEIINPSEETYGYYLFKVISNNGNTYIITGFDDDVDYYKGYMYPTGNGTAIELGSMGNHIFVMDTSEIENSINGETYSLNDILDMYIKQDKVDWNYKDVNITRGINKEYIIKIKNAQLIDGKGSSYINRWLYHNKGNFLKQLPSSCFKINEKNTKYMYYMNDLNVLGHKMVEDKEKLNKEIYSDLYLDGIRDLNDYNGAIDYYIEDGKVYIKHKDKEIIIMSE